MPDILEFFFKLMKKNEKFPLINKKLREHISMVYLSGWFLLAGLDLDLFFFRGSDPEPVHIDPGPNIS